MKVFAAGITVGLCWVAFLKAAHQWLVIRRQVLDERLALDVRARINEAWGFDSDHNWGLAWADPGDDDTDVPFTPV